MTSADQQKIPAIILTAFLLLSLAAAAYTGFYFLATIPFVVLAVYAGWQYPSFIFFILICSLPFSAEIMVTPSLGTDFPDEGIMLLVSLLFLGYWIYNPLLIPAKTLGHPLLLLLLLGMGWAIVTVVFSSQPMISIKFILAKTWYLGAFILAPLVIFRNRDMTRTTILLLMGSMISVTLITMLRHTGSGFSFATINPALAPFFRNHVNYSAMLVCMAPILWAIYKLNSDKKIRILTAIAFVVIVSALFLSYSRGAWLALFTGLAGWWLIKRKLIVISYGLVILAILISLYWIKSEDRYLRYAPDYRTTIFHEDFTQHLQATYEMKDVSTAERFYRWIAGIRMVNDNWLTGFGPGSFYNNYKPYAIPAYKTWVSDNKEHSTVHNYFLLLIIEQGLPGLLFFLLLAGAMLYYAQRLYHRASTSFYKYTALATGSVVVMLLTVNFLSDLIETDKIGSLFFLCVSLLVMTDINTRRPQ